MSEFLGSVFMISIFFLAGIAACYMLNMQALYVLWMQEQALCEAAEQMAEERKRCTPSFRY